MKGLFYKDLLITRKIFITLGIIQAIVSSLVILLAVLQTWAGEGDSDTLAVWVISYFFMFVLCNFLNKELFMADEKRGWSNFVISSPGTSEGQVKSKYGLILLLYLLIMFAAFLTDEICVVIIGDMNFSVSSAVFVIFCIELFLAAIELPFTFRFGVSYGANVKYGAIAVLIMVGIIYLLFGDLSVFKDMDLVEAIKRLVSGKGMMWVLALLPYAAGISYWISCRISIRLYKKGAENYEQ